MFSYISAYYLRGLFEDCANNVFLFEYHARHLLNSEGCALLEKEEE